MNITHRKLGFQQLEHRHLFAGDAIDVLDRAAVVSAYHEQFKPFIDVPVQWTGNTAGCDAGTVSASTNEATLNVLNYLRNMSGLESVALDSALSEEALQAALMMQAQNSLSHSPDPTWACYTAAGARAAGRSNLYLGVTGPAAMVGYVEDPGSGNTAVGHRRWIQNPFVDRMGIGSTSNANALYVITPSVQREAPEWISWPPQGYVPKELVFPRWSLSRQNADFRGASVQMKVDGALTPVSLKNVVDGFGLNTLVWQPNASIDLVGAEDFSIDIRVENVMIDGSPVSFEYTVIPIHPGPQVETVVAASNDRFATSSGETFVIVNVMANDNLGHPGWLPVQQSTLETLVVAQPAHGTILPAIDSPGVFFYYPEPGFVGVDSFTYRVANLGQGRVSNLATARISVVSESASAWQNPALATDVNLDGATTASDALTIINTLNRGQSNRVALRLDIAAGVFPPDYVDVNGDGFVSASDALDVINTLNRAASRPDGEQVFLTDTLAHVDQIHQSDVFDAYWLRNEIDRDRKRRR